MAFCIWIKGDGGFGMATSEVDKGGLIMVNR